MAHYLAAFLTSGHEGRPEKWRPAPPARCINALGAQS
jgi:hypothetical protein